jgi:hypothetical protein
MKNIKLIIGIFLYMLVTMSSCTKSGSCDYETKCVEKEPAGLMVGTMGSNPTSNRVATIFNTTNNSNAPIGNDWNDPTLGTNKINSSQPTMWTANAIGQVFGIALDHNSGIFLSATDIYKYDSAVSYNTSPIGAFILTPMASGYGPAGASGIYYTNYFNQSVTTSLVTTKPFPYTNTTGTSQIPNSGVGMGNSIGNIAYDFTNNQLFATNLEDGRIYRINPATGIVLSIFDPFIVDGGNSSPGIALVGEQLWGIGVYTKAGVTRVYFARTSSSTAKEIWSIPLTASGEFSATPAGSGLFTDLASTFITREISAVPGTQNKITDIAFSKNGKMLLAERGHPHAAGILEYNLLGTSWSPSSNFFLGADLTLYSPAYLFGKNSAGGVDYSNREIKNPGQDFICDDIVWGTGNALATIKLPFPASGYPNYVYGTQGMSSSGNNGTTLSINASKDLYINYNVTGYPNTINVKGKVGDIEFFDSNCPCK